MRRPALTLTGGAGETLRQSLRVKEDYRVTLLARTTGKDELNALDSEIARLEAELKQVNETILDLRQIQEQVIADDQTVLLEYSLGAEKSYVWAVTRTRVTSYELTCADADHRGGAKSLSIAQG